MLRLDEAPTTAGPTLRADRAALSPPRVQEDGAVRYSAVLARADVDMVYPWGVERAAEEALSAPEYLAGLRGLSVTLRHPRSERVDVRRPERDRGRVVGTVIEARWDAAERAVVLDLVVSDSEALAAIERGEIRELSEGYDVAVLDKRTDGSAVQRKRITNHVALVERGRMPGAVLRADGGEMDEDMAKRFDALDAAIGGYASRMDMCEKRMDEMAARFDARFPPEDEAEEATDEEEMAARQDAAISAEVDARDALRQAAARHGYALPADARDSRAMRRALAVHLGAPSTRIDAADGQTYAEAWIAARPVASHAHERGVRRADESTTTPKTRV